MPPRSGTTRRTKVHAREREFTLFAKTRGAFTLLVPAGRYSEGLLGLLVQDFLRKPGWLAFDLSRLDAVALPLIRAIGDFAAGLEPSQGRAVLVNPPDKIRALVKLVDREGRLAMALSESDLEGGPGEVDARLKRSGERLEVVRAMLTEHPCWQLADRESRWLCPFCVTLRPGIRFAARGSPAQATVNLVARHLAEECSTYTDGATDGWPFEVLERVIRHADGESAGPLRPAAPEPPKKREDELGERRRRLLPAAPPRIPGCDVGLHYRPSEPASGDFYDFVRLSGGRLAIVVGDVAPHGVEPAVLMGMARKVLRLRLESAPGPAEALAQANDDLCEELEGESYVTAAVAVVDGDRREVTLARAGHAAPFLVRSAPAPEASRLEVPGPLLGLVPTASFEEGFAAVRHELRPGDLLLLHTDGLEELRGPQGERFGAERVAAILKAHAPLEGGLVLGALILEAEQFSPADEREEDVTAICVKVR
jgi:hypothetical protein